jgi:hypothetical protein
MGEDPRFEAQLADETSTVPVEDWQADSEDGSSHILVSSDSTAFRP